MGIQRDSSPLILDWCQAAFFEEPFEALAGFLALFTDKAHHRALR